MIIHPIPPVYDEHSKILILGSFPSVKSREEGFFYGHQQNRFWKVTAAVLGADVPVTVNEKHAFLLRSRIALWDVIGSCDIDGSADSSIKNVCANDLSVILAASEVNTVFVNGKTAYRFYRRFSEKETGLPAVCLPSTSPANASWSIDRLIAGWSVIREALQN